VGPRAGPDGRKILCQTGFNPRQSSPLYRLSHPAHKYCKVLCGNKVTKADKPEESKPETRIYAARSVVTKCFIGTTDNCIRTMVEIE